ncbi:MAG: IS200/IS605 family transposase [Candidatus Omnitrophota bacterium]|nr:IS200/IS605 family transposase [Candidatus Omnitrophota bacterium]
MKNVHKGYHCAYQIHYHLALPLKYRKVLLSKEITEKMKEIAFGIQERHGLEIERLGCDINHVRILCSAHPKYAPGQLVRLFKSITAWELFHLFPRIKKELWGEEFWTDGYYVGTVGERENWAAVEKYIKG